MYDTCSCVGNYSCTKEKDIIIFTHPHIMIVSNYSLVTVKPSPEPFVVVVVVAVVIVVVVAAATAIILLADVTTIDTLNNN